jgi:serine/threonine-protein kinase HipA
MPRHFLQTAELAGVGSKLMRSIFEDLAANTEKQIDAVINTLPRGFPNQLITSVRAAIKYRAGLRADASPDNAAIADGNS